MTPQTLTHNVVTRTKFKDHLQKLCISPLLPYPLLSKALVTAFIRTHECSPEFLATFDIDSLPNATTFSTTDETGKKVLMKTVVQFFHNWHSGAYGNWQQECKVALSVAQNKTSNAESKHSANVFLQNIGYIQYEYRECLETARNLVAKNFADESQILFHQEDEGNECKTAIDVVDTTDQELKADDVERITQIRDDEFDELCKGIESND